MNCVVHVGGARVSSGSRGKAMWVTVEEDCSILCEEVQVVHTLAAICRCISSFTHRRIATNWGFSPSARIRCNVKCLEAAGKECGGEARDRLRESVDRERGRGTEGVMGTEGEMRSSRTAGPQYEGRSTRGMRGDQRLTTTTVGQKRRELRKRIRGGYESSFYFDCTFYQQEVGLIYMRRR